MKLSIIAVNGQENMIQVIKFLENMNQKKKKRKKGRGILTFS